MATTSTRAKPITGDKDPYVSSHRFSIDIPGVLTGGVNSVTSVESETEIIQYKDGEDGTMHTRPGIHRPGKIIVTKDWTNTPEFLNWYNNTLKGTVQRIPVIAIIRHNSSGAPISETDYRNCWVSKWTGPSLNSKSSAHATESVEISWETQDLVLK
jgi:phage tail-like protein